MTVWCGVYARWFLSLIFGLVSIALIMLPSTEMGFVSLAFWIYLTGRVSMRTQTQPFTCYGLRLLCAAVVLLAALAVTLFPFIVYGGHAGCTSFDPNMRTKYGQNFADLWAQFYMFQAANWLLAFLLVYMALADHQDSAYLRQSIRCVAYQYSSLAMRTIWIVSDACAGSDIDQNDLRDMADDPGRDRIYLAIGTYALAASSLSGIWALQLVVQRLEALQAGFGESLPYFRLILWLARVNVLWIWLLAFSVRVSTALTLGLGCAAALCILSMMCLMFRALSSPLRVLLECTPEGSDGVSEQLYKEVSFAVRIIHQAQLGIFLSNVSVSFRLVTAAAVAHFGSRVWFDAYQYGSMVDGLGNGLCLLLLSGGKLHVQNSLQNAQAREPSCSGALGSQDLPECTCATAPECSGPSKACQRRGWFEKVEELALRRISAERLLDFHARLGASKGPLMPHFDPKISTTSDVVRHAIIPESRQGELGSALASVWKCPSSSLGPRMVTHHWQNRFKDLVAVVVADGLGLKRWDGIALELEERQEEALQERLVARGSDQWQYWICAFCVNQHASICGNAMGGSDTVTQEVYPTCDCRTPKYFNDQPIQCELNKFDDMMLFLKNKHPYYLQVVATDTDFTIFSRAWCIAELAQASSCQMEQHLVLPSPETLELHFNQLTTLRVEDCSASREEDKEAILKRIGNAADIAKFNERLQRLLLGSDGLLAGWLDGLQCQQEVGSIAARAKARRTLQADPMRSSAEQSDFSV